MASARGGSEMDQLEKTCKSCDRLVASGTRMCACGRPTDQATFKERNEYEAKQWRLYKQGVAESA